LGKFFDKIIAKITRYSNVPKTIVFETSINNKSNNSVLYNWYGFNIRIGDMPKKYIRGVDYEFF